MITYIWYSDCRVVTNYVKIRLLFLSPLPCNCSLSLAESHSINVWKESIFESSELEYPIIPPKLPSRGFTSGTEVLISRRIKVSLNNSVHVQGTLYCERRHEEKSEELRSELSRKLANFFFFSFTLQTLFTKWRSTRSTSRFENYFVSFASTSFFNPFGTSFLVTQFHSR